MITIVENQKFETLESLEQDIRNAWLKEGIALKRIRDEKLFTLRGYASFADYYRSHLGYDKSTISVRIKAAETALNVIQKTEDLDPSQYVYRVLSQVPQENQQAVFDRACELAVSESSPRITGKHVQTAIIDNTGGYSLEVLETSKKWGFEQDIDKLNILQKWFIRGGKDHDSKFWAIYHSGVIDPCDGLDPCEFAVSTIEEITQAAERWKQAKIAAQSDFTPIIGILNAANLMVDGMNIVSDKWLGKKVKIIVKVLETK